MFQENRIFLPYQHTTTTPNSNNQRKEIGDQAIWTLSSAKAGNGVDQLRDDNINTFWQSDGTQPHFLNIQFLKKVRVQEIAIYLDFKQDESYTPNKISVRAGTSLQDTKEVLFIELKEPCGWYLFPLKTKLLNGSEKYYFFNIQDPSSLQQISKWSSSKINIVVKIPISDKQKFLDQKSTTKYFIIRKHNQGLSFPDFKTADILQYCSMR